MTASGSMESPDAKKKRNESGDRHCDSFRNLRRRLWILYFLLESADQLVTPVATWVPRRQAVRTARALGPVCPQGLVASGIVNYLDRSALSIANIEVRQELGLSATAMGVLLSAFLMSYAFSQLPAGILVDRVGPRILLGAGLVIWSLAQGAAGFVTSYTQFFAARIGLGIGESPQFPTGAPPVVSNWFHVKERGLPTGIFNAAPSIRHGARAAPSLTWLMSARFYGCGAHDVP